MAVPAPPNPELGLEQVPCPQFLYSATPAFPWAPFIHFGNLASADQCQLDDLLVGGSAPSTTAPAAGLSGSTTSSETALCAALRIELQKWSADPTGSTPTSCVPSLEPLLFHALANPTRCTHIFSLSGLSAVPDDLILPILTAAIPPEASYARCCAVAQGLLLPALARMVAPPTTGLTAAIQHLGSTSSQALAEHCFAQLLLPSKDSQLNKFQAELLVKVIKDGQSVPAQSLPALLLAACGGASPGGAWTEHLVAVLQAVVDARPKLQQGELSAVAAAVHGAAGILAPSVKLGKLLLAITKAYGAQLDNEGMQQHLRAASTTNGTFMAKTVLLALDKMQV